MLCPCGSELAFTQCCQLLISGTTVAQSPEQLMRSRYAAYATQHAEYIYQTYARSSQVEQSIADIAQWADQTLWLKLVIHHASDFAKDFANQQDAQVEFSAFYLHQGRLWQMRECSNFVIEQKAWRYLDGEVSESIEIDKPKRNAPCFCQSNKKFKHCCAKSF
ncbi:MAG: YchJ family protein [Cognaticolwellia sp.]